MMLCLMFYVRNLAYSKIILARDIFLLIEKKIEKILYLFDGAMPTRELSSIVDGYAIASSQFF